MEENKPENAPEQPPKKRGAGRVFAIIGIVLLAGVFVFAGYKLTTELISRKEGKETYEALQQQVNAAEAPTPPPTDAPKTEKATPEPTLAPEETEEPTPEPIEQPSVLEELQAQYPELIGWITIPGTVIDYPVMHSPERKWFYLNHDYRGEHASYGTPFLDEDCDPNDDVLLIYGHYQKNGTMFAQLWKYEKQDFWEQHRYFAYRTPTEDRVYEIFAAMRTRIPDDSEKNVFRYFHLDVDDKTSFDNYFAEIEKIALYDTGIDVQFGDEIILLSTCAYHVNDGRFVLAARRVADDTVIEPTASPEPSATAEIAE